MLSSGASAGGGGDDATAPASAATRTMGTNLTDGGCGGRAPGDVFRRGLGGVSAHVSSGGGGGVGGGVVLKSIAANVPC